MSPTGYVVQEADGTISKSVTIPKSAFAGQKADTPWNAIHVAYFSGEALWTYLNTPFLYTQERFAKEEIDSIKLKARRGGG